MEKVKTLFLVHEIMQLHRSIFLSTIKSSIFLSIFSSDTAKNPFQLQQNQKIKIVEELKDEAIAFRQRISHLLRSNEQTQYLNSAQSTTTFATLTSGSLIRLAFHDAATGYPNGSIQYEITEERRENRGLSAPLQLIQEEMPNFPLLSLADMIALAGAEAVYFSGGPYIQIKLGRKDAIRSDAYYSPQFRLKIREDYKNPFSQNNILKKTMPSPGLNSIGIRQYFHRIGLNDNEFIALCGSHGMGRHVTLLGMPKVCLKRLTNTCLDQANRVPFVPKSVDMFDNSYFSYLLKWYAQDITIDDNISLIPTDVALVVDPGLRKYVTSFANDQEFFFDTFVRAYQKLVNRGTTSRFSI